MNAKTNSNYQTTKNMKSLMLHIFSITETETSSNVTDHLCLSQDEVRIVSNSN